MSPSRPSRLLVCTGVLERDAAILLVASRYPNQPEPLWGLPGGRPRSNELMRAALIREFDEETSLHVEPGPLLYVSESFDRARAIHVINVTFAVSGEGTPRCGSDVHVVDLAWVPREHVAERVSVGVVREPLIAYLEGDERGYFGFAQAGITIDFADDP